MKKTIPKKHNKRVVVFGDFDLLHPGHLHFLREARKHGDELFVIVTRSSVIKKLKGRPPMFGQEHRRDVVSALSLVDHAMLGDAKIGSFYTLANIAPDVVCIGHDQKEFGKAIKTYYAHTKQNGRTRRLTPYNPKTYKSEHLKKYIAGESCLKCAL
jgi:FAD synthetase